MNFNTLDHFSSQEPENMGPKRSYICLAIFITAVLPLTLAVDCFNDVDEADFLFDGKKFENVDLEGFAAEKNSVSAPMTLSMVFSEFGFALVPLRGSPVSIPISSTVIRTLRC
jgi:hypothetical protein